MRGEARIVQRDRAVFERGVVVDDDAEVAVGRLPHGGGLVEA